MCCAKVFGGFNVQFSVAFSVSLLSAAPECWPGARGVECGLKVVTVMVF